MRDGCEVEQDGKRERERESESERVRERERERGGRDLIVFL